MPYLRELARQIFIAAGKKHSNNYFPDDSLHYYVAESVVLFTLEVIKQYGKRESEGVVYWAGKTEANNVYIFSAFAPRTMASRYGFTVSHDENANFVEFLYENNLEYISQIHSHPSSYVDHSYVDDEQTAFRREGLLSIVVPKFGKQGITPFKQCGIHQYTKAGFLRISRKYIDRRFHLYKASNILLKDNR